MPERRRFAKRNKYAAASRIRNKIRDLIGELHHKAARWLVDHFHIILLPAFETSDMALRSTRKIRSKAARMSTGEIHPLTEWVNTNAPSPKQELAQSRKENPRIC